MVVAADVVAGCCLSEQLQRVAEFEALSHESLPAFFDVQAFSAPDALRGKRPDGLAPWRYAGRHRGRPMPSAVV